MYPTIPRNRETFKNTKIAARVAENSKGDRRCLDEICAR